MGSLGFCIDAHKCSHILYREISATATGLEKQLRARTSSMADDLMVFSPRSSSADDEMLPPVPPSTDPARDITVPKSMQLAAQSGVTSRTSSFGGAESGLDSLPSSKPASPGTAQTEQTPGVRIMAQGNASTVCLHAQLTVGGTLSWFTSVQAARRTARAQQG